MWPHDRFVGATALHKGESLEVGERVNDLGYEAWIRGAEIIQCEPFERSDRERVDEPVAVVRRLAALEEELAQRGRLVIRFSALSKESGDMSDVPKVKTYLERDRELLQAGGVGDGVQGEEAEGAEQTNDDGHEISDGAARWPKKEALEVWAEGHQFQLWVPSHEYRRNPRPPGRTSEREPCLRCSVLRCGIEGRNFLIRVVPTVTWESCRAVRLADLASERRNRSASRRDANVSNMTSSTQTAFNPSDARISTASTKAS
mgnify:CR=1 FL=1